jgi:hypothetical protein
MRQAIRTGSFDNSRVVQVDPALTFKAFAAIYVERYVQANALASADTIEYRMAPLLRHFGGKLLRDIRTADIEDFIADLRVPAPLACHHTTPRVRRPATINRYLSLLTHVQLGRRARVPRA